MRLRISFLSAALAAQLALPVATQAVQPSGGQPASTTTWAPNELSAWDYVGSIGNASGVYLGNYGGEHWVLTAAHVGRATFRLGGYAYSSIADSAVALNPVGDAVNPPDLVLFRINPGNSNAQAYLDSMAIMELVDRPLAITTEVRLVGHGDDNDSAVIKSWGDNSVAGTLNLPLVDRRGNHYDTSIYYTLDVNGVRAIRGDSGGGMFYWTGTSWALAGIINATLETSEGVSVGIAIASLDAYMDQILMIIPEPATLAALSGLLALGSVLVARRRRRM